MKTEICLKKTAIWMEFLIDRISLKRFLLLFWVNFVCGFYCFKSAFPSEAPTSRHKKIVK